MVTSPFSSLPTTILNDSHSNRSDSYIKNNGNNIDNGVKHQVSEASTLLANKIGQDALLSIEKPQTTKATSTGSTIIATTSTAANIPIRTTKSSTLTTIEADMTNSMHTSDLIATLNTRRDVTSTSSTQPITTNRPREYYTLSLVYLISIYKELLSVFFYSKGFEYLKSHTK